MNFRHRIRQTTAGAIFLLGFGLQAARADWQPSPPGDPARQWRFSLDTDVGYDNNFNTENPVRKSSATFVWSPTAEIKIPGEQTAGQFRYQYTSTYFLDVGLTKPDESHVLDANVSHVFTPRLSASLTDSFRRGIEPTLVGPLIFRERGDYTYNTIGANISFLLTSRWTLSLNQSWEHWMFDTKSESIDNDRDGYGTTASAVYQLSPRTSVGLNYNYTRTAYSFSSITNSVRDSDSQALYLSINHRFKPLVFMQASAGAQLAGFGGGGSDASPYLNLSATYNFATRSTISAGGSYNIQLSELAAYRSSQQLATFLALSHDLTAKCSVSLAFNYIISTYGNFNPVFLNGFNPQPRQVGEDSWQVNLIARYAFTPWMGLTMEYTYQDLASGFDNRALNSFRSFDRMHGDVGIHLLY